MSDSGSDMRSQRRDARHAIAILSIANCLSILPVFLFSGLAILLMGDIGFGISGVGTAVAMFFAAASIGSWPAGRLVERVGPRYGLQLSAALGGLSMALIGLFTRDWRTLAIWMTCCGAATALSRPSVNVGVAYWVPIQRQGEAFGWNQAAVPLAGLIAGAAVPVVGLTVGWPWAFVAGAIFAWGFAAFLQGIPQRYSSRATYEPPMHDDAVPLESAQMHRSSLLALAAAAGCATASSQSLGAFLVLSIVAHGFDLSTGAGFLAAGSGAGILARLVTGYWADRGLRRYLHAILIMFILGSAGFAILGIAETVPLLVLGTVLSFGAGWGWPALFALAVVRANGSAPAAATGFVQSGTFIGGVVGPYVFGRIVEFGSYLVAWQTVACLGLLAAILTCGTIRLENRTGPLDEQTLYFGR